MCIIWKHVLEGSSRGEGAGLLCSLALSQPIVCDLVSGRRQSGGGKGVAEIHARNGFLLGHHCQLWLLIPTLQIRVDSNAICPIQKNIRLGKQAHMLHNVKGAWYGIVGATNNHRTTIQQTSPALLGHPCQTLVSKSTSPNPCWILVLFFCLRIHTIWGTKIEYYVWVHVERICV